MKNMGLQDQLKNAMIEYGAVDSKWRIKIIAVDKIGNSDFAKVSIETYKPRRRKPDFCHILFLNMVKKYICWDKSEHVNLK